MTNTKIPTPLSILLAAFTIIACLALMDAAATNLTSTTAAKTTAKVASTPKVVASTAAASATPAKAASTNSPSKTTPSKATVTANRTVADVQTCNEQKVRKCHSQCNATVSRNLTAAADCTLKAKLNNLAALKQCHDAANITAKLTCFTLAHYKAHHHSHRNRHRDSINQTISKKPTLPLASSKPAIIAANITVTVKKINSTTIANKAPTVAPSKAPTVAPSKAATATIANTTTAANKKNATTESKAATKTLTPRPKRHLDNFNKLDGLHEYKTCFAKCFSESEPCDRSCWTPTNARVKQAAETCNEQFDANEFLLSYSGSSQACVLEEIIVT